jgi:hypothetical protein
MEDDVHGLSNRRRAERAKANVYVEAKGTVDVSSMGSAVSVDLDDWKGAGQQGRQICVELTAEEARALSV